MRNITHDQASAALEAARDNLSRFEPTPTPDEIIRVVSKLSDAAARLVRYGALADADSARAAAQVKRLGLGYCACRKSKSQNPAAPKVASWSPSNNLGHVVRAVLLIPAVWL